MKNLTQNHTLVALAITLGGAIVQAVAPTVHQYVVIFVTNHPNLAEFIGATLATLLAALPGLNHQADSK